MEYLSLDQVKQIELNILKYVDAVCKEHNLRYFLSFGTLIGAIRHKGFIPWDDDIDISMPREDYEKLIHITENIEDPRYKVLSYKTVKYPYPFIKVVDSFTRIEDDGVVDYPHKGLWIDIFPIDGFKTPQRPMASKITMSLERLRSLASYRILPDKHKNHKILWKFSRMIGAEFFQNIIQKLSENRLYDSNDYAGCFYASLKIMKKEVYGNGTTAQFEGFEFSIPTEYDYFLREVYGDYMKLPPADQQISHCVKAYIVNK